MGLIEDLLEIFYAREGRIRVVELEEHIAKAMGASSPTVWITGETLEKQRNTHPEISAIDYLLLPNTLLHGVAIHDLTRRSPQLHCCHQARATVRTRATLKVTANSELLVVTFHIARKRLTRSLMSKGEKLRNHSWKW